MIKRNELQIRQVFPQLRVSYVNEDEINRLDPEHLSFFNVNNEKDLERARNIAEYSTPDDQR